METVDKRERRKKRQADENHPLNRKFSSWEEASQAKIDYIMRDKPATFWEDLAKAIDKIQNQK